MIRDMMLYHAGRFNEPRAQFEPARSLLNFNRATAAWRADWRVGSRARIRTCAWSTCVTSRSHCRRWSGRCYSGWTEITIGANDKLSHLAHTGVLNVEQNGAKVSVPALLDPLLEKLIEQALSTLSASGLMER